MSHNDQPPKRMINVLRDQTQGPSAPETLASGLSGLATEKVSTSVIFGGRTGAL
jgi:hypothetical protein